MRRLVLPLLLGVLTLLAVAPGLQAGDGEPPPVTSSWLVQADSAASAREAVLSVDGVVTHELSMVRAVAAKLTLEQYRRLKRTEGVRLFDNRCVKR